MLTLQALRNDRTALQAALKKRGLDAAPLLDRILDLDLERHLLAPFVPHGLQNTHTRIRDDLAIAQADKLTH